MSFSIENTEVRDFVAFLQLKNVSIQTIAQYQWVLKDFFRAGPSQLASFQEVTPAHLRDYVAGLQAKKLAAKTVGDRVTILKRFFGYLAAEGQLPSDPSLRLPLPKLGKRLPKALSLQEMRAFFAAIKSTSDLARRDRILFELMYAAGLRVSEAVALRLQDFDFADSSVKVVGKGNQERRIYLKPDLLRRLQSFIRTAQITEFLFRGYDEGHLNRRSVELRIKRYATAAGIKRPVTPHTLRHSIAVHCLQGGAPVSFVQALLGHASLATTGKYLQLTDEMAKEIALRVPTALEPLRAAAKKKKGKPRLREAPVAYGVGARVDWDAHVAVVVEWLAG